MKINSYLTNSIVDGDGIRFVVFTQGCEHNCIGCHNKKSWDINEGYELSINDLFNIIQNESLNKNVTISGGDPLLQAQECLDLVKLLKNNGYNIWLYTGWTIEEILESHNHTRIEILNYIDVLVEGKFDYKNLDKSPSFKGSHNQKIIKNIYEYIREK